MLNYFGKTQIDEERTCENKISIPENSRRLLLTRVEVCKRCREYFKGLKMTQKTWVLVRQDLRSGDWNGYDKVKHNKGDGGKNSNASKYWKSWCRWGGGQDGKEWG